MSALEAALALVERGWAIFPCDPRTKRPLLARAKDPIAGTPIPGTGGLKQASTDPVVIRQWKTRWPDAMVGLPVGSCIGAFVVDIDAGTDPDTGEVFTAATLQAALEAAIGEPLPTTWTASTPRGGLHLYFSVPSGEAFPGNSAGIIPRIDVRGDGGFVICPPSVRADGKPYTWVVPPTEDYELAVAPLSLIKLLTKPRRNAVHSHRGVAKAQRSVGDHIRYGEAALRSELDKLAAALPGTRNDTLFHASIRLGQLIASGVLTLDPVKRGLESVVRAWPNFQKSLGTIQSGLFKGLNEPRQRPAGRSAFQSGKLAASMQSAPSELDAELAEFDLTDYGNALRFAERNKGQLVFCEKTRWLWWNLSHWSSENSETAVQRAVKCVIEGLRREASAQ